MRILFTFFLMTIGLLLYSNPWHDDDTTKILKQKPEYTVSLVQGINTPESEFCATSYGSDIVFVGSQPKDLVNNNSPLDVNGVHYTDVFIASMKDGRIKNKKSLSTNINGIYHDGPITFNKNQTIAYLTRVEYKKGSENFVNRAKIFVFEKKANTWWGASPFFYNNDSYSVGHTALSPDGNFLFFSSDMPGGYGGKDIYVCRKTGNGWDQPENLGPHVNTTGDEEYPFMRDDELLFFSSTGHVGLGGFDIFTAYSFNGKWLFKKNEGPVINSRYDDFGIVFSNAIAGYFSSNRPGGAGGDDIYTFTFSSEANVVSARLMLTESLKEPARNTLVYLMTNNGVRIDSMHTDQDGLFEFKNLYDEKTYMISVEPRDAEMKEKARFYLANDNSEIVRVSQQVKGDKFIFKNLPLEKSILQEVFSDDDLTLSGVLTYSSNPALFLANVKINLINSYGDVVESVTTNELGSFVFKNLPADQNYLVEIPDENIKLPYGTTVTLSDKNGKKLKNFITGKEPFRFKLLPPEHYSLTELAVDENVVLDDYGCFQSEAKLKPVANKKIYLVDAQNKKIDSCVTNSRGFFKFANRSEDRHYTAYFETSEQSLTLRSSYYLKGQDGKMIRTAYLSQGRKHIFRKVPVDSASLQSMDLSEKLTLAGKLRYGESGNKPLENIRVRLLDAKGKTVDSVTANKSGCFIFRDVDSEKTFLLDMDANDIKLPSNTRVIMAACDGKIIKTFYVGKDKFEYKILPVEKNLMPDLIVSESDLAMILTGFIFGENRRPLKNISLTLRDTSGKIREVIKTGMDGKFTFKSLKDELASMIELSKDTSDAVLYIADSKGRIYKRVVLKNGKFEYKLLDVDKAMMAEFVVNDPWLEVTQMRNANDRVTIIENIYYGTNDFKFDSTGQKRLDKAIYALKLNAGLRLEVGSHTDSRANDSYNLELSNKRASYAVDYIISKGISRDRISGIGYGEKKLLNKCSNDIFCTDEQHAINRRTEFKLTYSEKASGSKQ